jgi:hypothetical protein
MTAAVERSRRRAQPRRAAPMLAVLTEKRFSDPGWIYDGVREHAGR